MALALLSRKSGGFDEYLTGRIVITPVPVVRHPEKFTPARAGLVAVGKYAPIALIGMLDTDITTTQALLAHYLAHSR